MTGKIHSGKIQQNWIHFMACLFSFYVIVYYDDMCFCVFPWEGDNFNCGDDSGFIFKVHPSMQHFIERKESH